MINAFALSSPKCAKSDSEIREISTELSRFVPDLRRLVKWSANKTSIFHYLCKGVW